MLVDGPHEKFFDGDLLTRHAIIGDVSIAKATGGEIAINTIFAILKHCSNRKSVSVIIHHAAKITKRNEMTKKNVQTFGILFHIP